MEARTSLFLSNNWRLHYLCRLRCFWAKEDTWPATMGITLLLCIFSILWMFVWLLALVVRIFMPQNLMTATCPTTSIESWTVFWACLRHTLCTCRAWLPMLKTFRDNPFYRHRNNKKSALYNILLQSVIYFEAPSTGQDCPANVRNHKGYYHLWTEWPLLNKTQTRQQSQRHVSQRHVPLPCPNCLPSRWRGYFSDMCEGDAWLNVQSGSSRQWLLTRIFMIVEHPFS